jgi:phage-related protein
MLSKEKPIEWIGSSYKDLMGLPADVRRFLGFALSLKITEVYVKGLRK